MAGKRYYWVKLMCDFFEQPNIMLLENEDNGREYVMFYLKLLLKSIRTDGITEIGELRLNKSVAYTDDMLAKVTHTDIDIAKSAIDILIRYGMMIKNSDDTYYLPEAGNLIGSETEDAQRKRESRQKKETSSSGTENDEYNY